MSTLELLDPAKFNLGLLIGRSFSEQKIDLRTLFFSQGILMPESEARDIDAALRAASYPGMLDMVSADDQEKDNGDLHRFGDRDSKLVKTQTPHVNQNFLLKIK